MARQAQRSGSTLDHQRVLIQQINHDTGIAQCINQQNQTMQVPISVRWGKGGWPRVGEEWVVSRMFSIWSFAACVTAPAPPVITASRTGESPLLIQVLDALISAGLVQEAPAPEVVEDTDS